MLYGREVLGVFMGGRGKRGGRGWEEGKGSVGGGEVKEGKGEEEKGGKIKDCSSSVLYLTNTT